MRAISNTNSQHRLVEDELSVLTEFKEMKANLESKLQDTAQELEDQQRHHQEVLHAVERKFLEEKARIQKEAEKRTEEIKREPSRSPSGL